MIAGIAGDILREEWVKGNVERRDGVKA